MNRHSIFLKIIGLFLFSLISFGAFSFYFIQGQIEKEQSLSSIKYRQVTIMINRLIRNTPDITIINNYLKELGFEKTNNKAVEQALLAYKDELLSNYTGIVAKSIKLHNDIYILLQENSAYTLYSDHIKSSFKTYYIITFGAISLIVVLFFMILRSLLPLKHLNNQIRKIANGNLEVHCALPQKDEIGELSIEFQRAIDTMRAVSESRSLFLRSIMHELKTPITTGMISAEMVDNETQKKRLTTAFTRLNHLINEFAKIEQLSSKAYKFKKYEFGLCQLLNIVSDMLLIPPNSDILDFNCDSVLIKADMDLFALAVKNLIDNAIKYKTGGKIRIFVNLDKLIIANEGTKLTAEFSEYFKPYFKNKDNNNSGFGLGLYIIKNTLEVQGFDLNYEHKEGVNYFTIKGCVVSS